MKKQLYGHNIVHKNWLLFACKGTWQKKSGFHLYLPERVRGKGVHGKGVGFPEQGGDYLNREWTI